MKIKESPLSRIFDAFNILFMIFIVIVTLYPFVYLLSASLSNSGMVSSGEVWLYPKGFTFEAYERVASDPFIWVSYRNTIIYTVLQVVTTLIFTAITAYPLSKRRLVGRTPILMAIGFTIMFNGGLVPTYLVVKYLGLTNTMWALIVPGLINTFYLFIMRTFFMGLPEELEDAAIIDGCSTLGVLFRIVIPLSLPVMVTVGLFTAVAQWNSYFQALIYLTDKELYPLQIYLRNVVISGSAAAAADGNNDSGDQVFVLETIKYATVMFATLPILCIYPFIQKYFVQGALIGGIKG